MSIFKQIHEGTSPESIFARELKENVEQLQEFVDAKDMSIEDLQRAFEAARRGLSLAHKLPDPAEKARHFSRILTNMNKIRAVLNRHIKELEAEAGMDSDPSRDVDSQVGPY
jgi:hypothetical protein